jgi:hypothetical protein
LIGADTQTGTAMSMKNIQAVSQISDRQPEGVALSHQIASDQSQVLQSSDGQVQASTMSQITDRKSQFHTASTGFGVSGTGELQRNDRIESCSPHLSKLTDSV